MPIINQPFTGTLGFELKKQLSKDYTNIVIISAFAKSSGIDLIEEDLNQIKKRGGQVTVVVGIDMGITTKKALEQLNRITSDLYVVHSENPSQTFHPKMYIMWNATKAWYAVGSNNLTEGGLLSNMECANCFELVLSNPADNVTFEKLLAIVKTYTDGKNALVMKIQKTDEIQMLFEEGYIEPENKFKYPEPKIRKRLFGKGYKAPKIEIEPKIPTNNQNSTNLHNRFWFQTLKMTGGSRNILDLSKTGTIIMGSAEGTPYSIDGKKMLGGVSFFGINPDSDVESDITIRYKGKDYAGNTIKYSNSGSRPNLSWRIQLKGATPSGRTFTSYSDELFVDKILIFEKIEDNLFEMTIEKDTDRKYKKICESSIVVATNGSGNTGRRYGILKE